MRSRPQTVSAATILLALFSVLNLVFPFFPIEGIPTAALYLGIVEGVAGLLSAAGLWMLRKWGLRVTIIVSVLNIGDAAPAIAFAPNAALQSAATITAVGFALIIVLVVLPSSRRAFRSHPTFRER